MKTILALLSYDLRLAARQPMAWSVPLLFYVIVVSLFAIVLAPQPQLLAKIAPIVLWIAVLLASLLAQERGLRTDFAEGSLEQLCLSPRPLALMLLAKVTAHWIVTMLPLIVLTPILALAMYLDSHVILTLILSLLLGTPIICLLAGIASALTVGLANGSLFLAVLLLPLYIPVLIFSIGMVINASQGLPVLGLAILLLGILVLALTLAPLAMAYALRVGMTQN